MQIRATLILLSSSFLLSACGQPDAGDTSGNFFDLDAYQKQGAPRQVSLDLAGPRQAPPSDLTLKTPTAPESQPTEELAEPTVTEPSETAPTGPIVIGQAGPVPEAANDNEPVDDYQPSAEEGTDHAVVRPQPKPSKPQPKPKAQPKPVAKPSTTTPVAKPENKPSTTPSKPSSKPTTTPSKPEGKSPSTTPGKREGATTPTASRGRSPEKLEAFWDNPRFEKRDTKNWTAYTIAALTQHGRNLLKTRPADVTEFCPAFDKLNAEGRMAFWLRMVSAVAFRESGYNTKAKYDEKVKDRRQQPVISRGLMQISFGSGRDYGCRLETDEDLHLPEKNLTCGVIIIDRWVSRDKRITGQNENKTWMGIARYFAVLRSKKSKEAIRASLSSLDFCKL